MTVAMVAKRLAVAIAVDDLVSEKPFESLRIEDICEAAGVSRSAFYRLFADKYEIPLWCQGLAFDAGLGEIGRSLTCADGHRATLSGLLLFRNLMYSASIESGPYSFRTKLINKHAASMRETLTEVQHVALTPRLEFLIVSTADAQGRAVFRWLDGGANPDVETFAQWQTDLTPEDLRSLLDTPATPAQPGELTFASIIADAVRTRR